jgi:hypothetical protein
MPYELVSKTCSGVEIFSLSSAIYANDTLIDPFVYAYKDLFFYIVIFRLPYLIDALS